MFNLTFFSRNYSEKYSGLMNECEKPRIKLMRGDTVEYISLINKIEVSNPEISVLINGEKKYLNDIDNWYAFERFIDGISNLTKQGTPSINKKSTTSGGYYFACMPKNGRIFYSPYKSGKFCFVDTETQEMELFGDCANITNKKGCCVAQNGKIYVFDATSYEIDPITLDVVSFLGVSTSTNCLPGRNKDKNIYFVSGTNFVSFDPDTKTFGSFAGIKYANSEAIAYSKEGLIIYNGKNPSATSGSITTFDQETETIVNIDTPTYSGSVGCVLANDLNIYFLPSTTTRMSKLNTDTMELTQVGPSYGNTKDSKHVGLVMGADGKLYGGPSSNKNILIFDPTDETIVFAGNFYPTQSLGGGGIINTMTNKMLSIVSTVSYTEIAVIEFSEPNAEYLYVPLNN